MTPVTPSLQNMVAQQIEIKTKRSASIASSEPLGGGCINQAAIVRTEDGRSYFVKSSSDAPAGMFSAEAASLQAMRVAGTIRIPEVIALGTTSSNELFLVLEAIESGPRASDFFVTFGRQLAKLHRNGASDRYGFETDNWLGSTAQPNPWMTDWVEFFATARLEHQLRLAADGKRGGAKLQQLGQRLIDRLAERLAAPDEKPALIHGDLWSGNYLPDEAGQPVLIDPAVYYAHREAEFGMTTLFGGLPPEFYAAYEQAYPLADGWESRVEIYRLYHLLNHLNLFGSSYLSGCLEILERYA